MLKELKLLFSKALPSAVQLLLVRQVCGETCWASISPQSSAHGNSGLQLFLVYTDCGLSYQMRILWPLNLNFP